MILQVRELKKISINCFNMKIHFKKLTEKAVIPTKAHPTDAGFDLTAVSKEYKDGCFVYGTGIAIELPQNYVGLLFPRSCIYRKDLRLTNAVGVIDSGYTGEITFKFAPTRNGVLKTYRVGDRVGQLIIIPFPEIEFEEVPELADSERGANGYGSTGD